MKNILTIILILFLFSGCGFSSDKKVVEIQEDQEKYKSQEINNEEKIKEDSQDENLEKFKIEKETKLQEVTENVSQEENNDLQTLEEVQGEKKDSEEKSSDFKIKEKLVSWGFEKASSREIDTIIIHSSYNVVGSDEHDLDDIIYKEYKPYGVSPHYIISREGKVYRLVEDKNIAYHAGESTVPDGRTNVNNFSIGIEIVNTKEEKPSGDQYDALKNLIEYLKDKYEIKYVLSHNEIAPGRKTDPWNFDYDKVR